MSRHDDGKYLDKVRQLRNDALKGGFISAAATFDEKIEERTGESEKPNIDEHAAAALSGERDSRLHQELDDADEVRERYAEADKYGYPELAQAYAERHEELTGEHPDPEPEPSDAALKEQTCAALADPDDETQDMTQAALSVDDAIETTDRGQLATQYVFDRYGIDPRDYDDEYELRAALRDAEPKQEAYTPTESAALASDTLSVGVRNRIESKDVTAEALIKREYGLDPDDYGDIEKLRAAIVAKSGYEDDEPNAPSRSSAFSDPNDRL